MYSTNFSRINHLILSVVLSSFCCACGGDTQKDNPASDKPVKDLKVKEKASRLSEIEVQAEVGKLAVLGEETRNKILSKRVDFTLISPFERLSKTILSLSQDQFEYAIYPVALETKVKYRRMLPTNPLFYKPTLRQYLDNIATQTLTRWSYTKDSEVLDKSIEDIEVKKPILAFQFSEKGVKKELPYSIKMVKGWSSQNIGLILKMHPEECPIGLDIMNLGQFSSDSSEVDENLLKKVREDVALTWARRASRNKLLSRDKLSKAKVASYDAIYYEKDVKTKIGFKAKWRQWVFTVKNRCYLVLSTIYPNYEAKLYPEVKEMLSSFKSKE